MEYKYTVCNWCFTYNHADYITEALDSFANQITNFDVINVVVDDASTDGEQPVIKKWANEKLDFDDKTLTNNKQLPYGRLIHGRCKTHTNLQFVFLLLKDNHYQHGRNNEKIEYISEWTINSKYLTICEGDDFWIDPNKLTKQVKALDSHPETDMCACSAYVYKEGKTIGKMAPYDYDTIIPLDNVILGGGGYLATNSLMYRSSIHKSNQIWRQNWLDYFLQVAGALRGGILYLSDYMAAYRYLSANSWSASTYKQYDVRFKHEYKALATSILMDVETGYEHSEIIEQANVDTLFVLFRYGLLSNKYNRALRRMSLGSRLKLLSQMIMKTFFPNFNF